MLEGSGEGSCLIRVPNTNEPIPNEESRCRVWQIMLVDNSYLCLLKQLFKNSSKKHGSDCVLRSDAFREEESEMWLCSLYLCYCFLFQFLFAFLLVFLNHTPQNELLSEFLKPPDYVSLSGTVPCKYRWYTEHPLKAKIGYSLLIWWQIVKMIVSVFNSCQMSYLYCI